MKLQKVKTLKVKITTITWLHIGAGNTDIEIWWIDNPVVKTKDGYPYIPWSSLKWKLRSLYEIKTWKITEATGKEWKYWDIYHLTKKDFDEKNKDALFICKVFWTVLDKDLEKKEKKSEILAQIWPTRAIFRDLYLSEESKKKLDEYKEKTWNMLENKAEVALARYGFKSGWLRNIERVPAWITFEWEIKVRIFENDDEDKILNWLKELLENDLKDEYLGWWGSRWNWQIEVKVEII